MLLGGSADVRVEWHCERMFAGQVLPQLRKGDLIEGGKRVGHLPQRTTKLQLNAQLVSKALAVGAEWDAPPGWTAQYAVLNRFDYQLSGAMPDILRSAQCFVIQQGDDEYILPAPVVLQTFYCFETRLANAILRAPWKDSASEVISFSSYDSGICTREDPESGDWYIVMRLGFTKEHAAPLALLWFDPFARAQANAIRSNASRVNHGNPSGAKSNAWFIAAQIPYDLSTNSIELSVRCLPLRPWRTNGVPAKNRYLITSINGYSWPLVDQQVWWELHNSSETSDRPQESPDPSPFGGGNGEVSGAGGGGRGGGSGGKPPDKGGDGKPSTSDEEPDARSSDYVVEAVPIMMLTDAHLQRQRKSSHKVYQRKRPRSRREPKDKISGGTGTHNPNAPGQLEADSHKMPMANEFNLLVQALDRLRDGGAISSYTWWSPTEDVFREMRQERPCWHFIREDRLAAGLPRYPCWEVIRGSDEVAGRSASQRRRRALLVIKVVVEGTTLVLLEIERRSPADTYRLFCVEPTRYDDDDMLRTIMRLAVVNGRPKLNELADTFEPLGPRRVVRIQHAYEGGKDAPKRLDDESLLARLHLAAGVY